MADVDLTSGAVTGHPSRRQRHTPYVIRKNVTAAAAVAAKGSALATGDVIQVADIPANSVVLAGGMKVNTIDSGTAAPADLSVGSTDFVSAAALTSAAAKPSVDAVASADVADTLDIVLGTLSAAGDDWDIDVWALVCDVSAYPTVQDAKSAS